MAKSFYRIKIIPLRDIRMSARYGYGVLSGGKATTILRKLTPTQAKKVRKDARLFGYKVISIEKIKRGK